MANGDQTTAYTWIGMILSITILAARLVLRRVRRQSFTPGDYWCLTAAVFAVARLPTAHIQYLYGATRTVPTAFREALLRPEHHAKAAKIVVGSKLVIVHRSLLMCILWCLKMAVFDFLQRLMRRIPYERLICNSFLVFLSATFVASIISNLAACRPFNLYWQIYPDPGSCIVGNVWLYTYEICNILTDLMLMGYSIILILSVKIAMRQRLKIIVLFSIGILLIFISVVRIVLSKDARSSRNLVLWSSLEVFFAAVVAVTPTTYGLISNHAEKHTSAKTVSITTPAQRTPTRYVSLDSADGHTCHLSTVLADLEKGVSGGE